MHKFLIYIMALIGFSFGFISSSFADEQEELGKLKAMLTDIEAAINEKDIERVLGYLHPEINIVFQNSEVVDGIEAVRAFNDRMLGGDSPVLSGHSVIATEDKPAEIYGNTAVAYGTSIDNFQFTDGMDIEVVSKWTTTLIKENDTWKVISLQLSTNVFDNPLLSAANASIKYFTAGGLILGIFLCFAYFRWIRKSG